MHAFAVDSALSLVWAEKGKAVIWGAELVLEGVKFSRSRQTEIPILPFVVIIGPTIFAATKLSWEQEEIPASIGETRDPVEWGRPHSTKEMRPSRNWHNPHLHSGEPKWCVQRWAE
jgi:hypothetical protein